MTNKQITSGFRSSHFRPQLRALKKLLQQSSQSIFGQEQSTLLERRHSTQRTQRMRKNAPVGIAITMAMMAMNAVDPKKSEPEDDPPEDAVGFEPVLED